MRSGIGLRDQIAAGVAAGIAGGILIDLFLIGLTAASAPGGFAGAAVGIYSFIASVALGQAAYANPGTAVPLGILIHFAVAIGWALGYVYLVRSQPQLLRRPWLSGLTFGLMVMIFMNVMLIAAGLYHRPNPTTFFAGLVAHLLFYGVPVALVVSRMLARSVPTTR